MACQNERVLRNLPTIIQRGLRTARSSTSEDSAVTTGMPILARAICPQANAAFILDPRQSATARRPMEQASVSCWPWQWQVTWRGVGERHS